MSDTTQRRAVIISTHVSLLEPLVERGGFTVVGAADTAMNGERLVQHFRPDVIVLDNDLPFVQGVHAIPSLRALSPESRVVLVVNEHWSPDHTSSLGTSVVIGRDELVDLEERLHALETVIDLRSSSYAGIERRSGHDRRVQQDWSKVGWERRKTVRRAVDRMPAPEPEGAPPA